MKKTPLLVFGLACLLTLTSSGAWAAGHNCDNASHFSYGPLNPYGQWTFTGTGGSPITTNFRVTAPSGDGFPVGHPPSDCAPTATATIEATEVSKIADANGNTIDPISEDGTPLGDAIAAAFAFAPNPWANFAPGDSTNVVVTVNNPNVDPADFGDYDVKLAAHDNGSGIGVGPGPHFTLKLRAQPCLDTVPDVTIIKLNGDPPGVLGTAPLTFSASDSCDQVVSMTATISSAGGAVNQAMSLGISPSLPVPAHTTATGTGSYTQFGGTGSPGTTDALAFTGVSGNRSGIGNYTVTAQAIDQSNDTGADTWTFDVNYTVTFTRQFVPSTCIPGRVPMGCNAELNFTVNRSSVSSDGAFMYDHSVLVVLLDGSNNVIATHPYGVGSVSAFTQINPVAPMYLTTFTHPVGKAIQTYHAVVYFVNIDGSVVAQATSGPLTF